MIGRQLYGHGPSEVVTDNVGAREAEMRTEGVEEPAPVPNSIPRDGLVRFSEPTKIQGINRKPLCQTPRELLPETRRGEPTMHQNDRGPATHDVVADQHPFQLQILRVAGTLHLAG